jgi:hypothetical protein
MLMLVTIPPRCDCFLHRRIVANGHGTRGARLLSIDETDRRRQVPPSYPLESLLLFCCVTTPSIVRLRCSEVLLLLNLLELTEAPSGAVVDAGGVLGG